MARPRRNTPGGYCYHVLTRGNARQQVFFKTGDYEAFLRLFEAAQAIVPMRVVAYCLMPNHFHLILWPHGDADLSRWMQWVLTTHVRRYHQNHGTSGHVWQGRFKSFPIQADDHLLTAIRYVERNALRAGLATDVLGWAYSSLVIGKPATHPTWYDAGPVPRGRDWLKHVAEPQTDAELIALRRSVIRGIPFGETSWQQETITELGLESTLRNRGRPKRTNNEAFAFPFCLSLLPFPFAFPFCLSFAFRRLL